MSDSTPRIISAPTVSRKLALGKDVNAAMAGLVASLNAAVPDQQHHGTHSLGLRHYVIKVTGAEMGAAKYKCSYWLEVKHSLLDPTVDLTDDDLFDDSDKRGDDGVFVNLPEKNRGDHALTGTFDSDVGIGWFIGWTDDDRPVFLGFMLRFDPCAPSP